MEKKNWVLTVSVNRPFMGTVNLRHYLNGFTQEQAAIFRRLWLRNMVILLWGFPYRKTIKIRIDSQMIEWNNRWLIAGVSGTGKSGLPCGLYPNM